ncbi:hypothetical protein [Rhodanobacter spathiphylli]|uniref:Uncharacterized protein n=1 Tax=Rhodanobacter spathiphylli B39 TaxID=1163407 RepID=I4VVP5_9GAMM|nr:hypothetical protein [Rhodanobacter spathiphylli]EIL91286.1 hypothetical protein UU7_13788 [Rhodanobacter spathiphylli B39]
MSLSSKLGPRDHENLARVAQGQAAMVDEAGVERLIAAGLVLHMAASEVAPASFQLTPAGLALIRSSDQ